MGAFRMWGVAASTAGASQCGTTEIIYHAPPPQFQVDIAGLPAFPVIAQVAKDSACMTYLTKLHALPWTTCGPLRFLDFALTATVGV